MICAYTQFMFIRITTKLWCDGFFDIKIASPTVLCCRNTTRQLIRFGWGGKRTTGYRVDKVLTKDWKHLDCLIVLRYRQ